MPVSDRTRQLCSLWASDWRYMTFWERCRVGWQLWRDGVSRWPLPACKTNPELWITSEELLRDKHSYPEDEPDCRLCGAFGPTEDDDDCTWPQWVWSEASRWWLSVKCKRLKMSPLTAGFTLGLRVVPGVVSDEFKAKLEIYGAAPQSHSSQGKPSDE